MKVFLVEMDNGESYEDYNSWVEKAFTSFRKASEWLINNGYKSDFTYSIRGEIELYFYSQDDEYLDRQAWIVEMEVED